VTQKIKTNVGIKSVEMANFKMFLDEFKKTGHENFIRQCMGLIPTLLLLFMLILHFKGRITNLSRLGRKIGMGCGHVHNVIRTGVKLGMLKKEKNGRALSVVLTRDGVLCTNFLLNDES